MENFQRMREISERNLIQGLLRRRINKIYKAVNLFYPYV
jgi:hypothetical protein